MLLKTYVTKTCQGLFPPLTTLDFGKKKPIKYASDLSAPSLLPPPPPAQLLTRGEAQGSERGKAEAWCPPGRGHSEGRRFTFCLDNDAEENLDCVQTERPSK